jgi:hypothetical protein
MKKLSVNEFLFLKWANKFNPAMFEALVGDPRQQLAGFMDSLSTGLQSFLTEAPKVYGQYLQGKQQIDAMKMNVKRAQAGLAPIDPSTGQPITAYTPGYDVPPGMTRNFFESVPTWAWVAGGGLVLLLVLKK